MRMMRNVSAGLAACFVIAAVISYIVNFDHVETTTAVLGAIGFGLGVFSVVVGRAVQRR
jgi:formate/nitrite transporter FocA (FNT family)